MKLAGNNYPSPLETTNSHFSGEPGFIYYVTEVPTLKSIAMVAVAVRVWGYPDWGLPWPYPNRYTRQDYGALETEAVKKFSKVALPESLKHQICNIIRPIALQWIKNVNYAQDYAPFSILNELYKERGSSYWTMTGIFDQVRFFEEVTTKMKEMNYEAANFTTLFEYACTYCTEESISDLWLEVHDKDEDLESRIRVPYEYSLHLVAYWAAWLNNELPGLMRTLENYDPGFIYNTGLSIFENMISCSIITGNVTAFKYFWHKLTEQEKISNLEKWIELVMKTLKIDHCIPEHEELFYFFTKLYFDFDSYDFVYQDGNAHTYIMCFLLSHVCSQMKQKEIFETHVEIVLHSLFFHWPFQRFFLPTIYAVLDSLHEIDYVKIMTKIAHTISKRRTHIIFREIWVISPLNLQKAFIQFQNIHATAIAHLLNVGDDVTIDMILNQASKREKVEITNSMLVDSIFREFLYSNKFALCALNRLTSKTLPSKRDLNLFKSELMARHASSLSYDWIFTVDFSALDELWNWAYQSSEEIQKFKEEYINLEDIYQELTVLGNFEHVDDFLSWYFETDEEISIFKKTFLLGRDSFYYPDRRSLLESFSDKGKDGWMLFEKFLNYSFNSSEEISRFKKVVSYCIDCIMRRNSEFGTLFQNWCFSLSDKAI